MHLALIATTAVFSCFSPFWESGFPIRENGYLDGDLDTEPSNGQISRNIAGRMNAGLVLHTHACDIIVREKHSYVRRYTLSLTLRRADTRLRGLYYSFASAQRKFRERRSRVTPTVARRILTWNLNVRNR